jgi:hypothetical protein
MRDENRGSPAATKFFTPVDQRKNDKAGEGGSVYPLMQLVTGYKLLL